MNVGNSVRKAIDDWGTGDLDSAMLHACNAVDGTAKKRFPKLGNKQRFCQLLRENYAVLGPMGAPGVNLRETPFPVGISNPTGPGGVPDIADVIYVIHRCSHGHGDELPKGFELLRDTLKGPGSTTLAVEKGKVRLSDRVIFGLLAVAVFSPSNKDQSVPKSYHFTFGRQALVLPINEWWGRVADFSAISATEPTPLVKLDFTDWMDDFLPKPKASGTTPKPAPPTVVAAPPSGTPRSPSSRAGHRPRRRS